VLGGDRKEVFAGLRDQFDSINAISVTLTGREIAKLSKTKGVGRISLDAVGARWYWGSTTVSSTAAAMPAIAIVDSGVAPQNGDLGSCVVASVDLATSLPNSPGDGYGHGTMAAGLAAGELYPYTGVNPRRSSSRST